MKIKIKNLKGQVFTVEAQPTQTIVDIKEAIKTEKGFSVQSQKIIFKGKTIPNEQTISKLDLKQTDCLVVMAHVQKPQPKVKVEDKNKKQEKTENQGQVKKQQKKQEKKDEATQAQITELMTMGFSRQKCFEALRAAFNNNQRAVQYLINGIPTNLQGNPKANSQQQISSLAGLTRMPQFNQIRQMLQENPGALQNILSQLAETSPQLYNLIAQHPQEFQRMLLEGDELEYDEQGQEMLDESQQNLPPGSIVVSQEEQDAINRLSTLGFSKIESAQAYMACDKNEDLAANLLFDRLANGDIEQYFGGSSDEQGN